MSRLAYRCLVLDHDDTVADSTRAIHYPAYLAFMRELRPLAEPLSFAGWMRKNFYPGIMPFLTDEVGLDELELEREYEIWRSFSVANDPPFFDGILQFLSDYRGAGGIVAVVSHSEAEIITRNYRVASNGRFEPDAVYGWELPAERRKPSSWPVLDVVRRYDLEPKAVLVVDDLKPGVDMARSAGVAVAGAGWGYDIPEIEERMRSECDYYFSRVVELTEHVLNLE